MTRMCLDFLGEDAGLPAPQAGRFDPRSVLVMGMSGEAFRQWDTLYQMNRAADLQRVFRGAMAGIGRDYELVLPDAFAGHVGFAGRRFKDADDLARTLVEQIDRGRPALLLEGGKWPDWRLITGYDRGGRVLVGFGGDLEQSGFVPGYPRNPQKEYPAADLVGGHGPWLVFLGSRKPAPDRAALYRDALANGLRILRQRRINGKPVGPDTFIVWAKGLRDDVRYPAGDDGALRKRWEDHRVTSAELAERRAYAMDFLDQAIEQLPTAAEELRAARACFQAEHDQVWAMWNLTGGYMHPDSHQKLADPGTRRKIADLVDECRAKDAEAADHIERALAKAGR